MRPKLIAATLAAALLAVGAAGARADAPPAPVITVHGSQLLRNGDPWVARGVQIVGDVAPDGALSGKYIPAHQHFGAAELQAAAADHADVIRFQVSQFGIDPQGPLYSAGYVQEVREAVSSARALGLAAIVSLQAEPPAGEPTRCPLPDAGAQRAWAGLAGMFAGDPGVMFELYNEPAIAPTATDWALWRDGGTVTFPGGSCQAVGMQTLVGDIRVGAPDNVIVVPGLAGEQTLAGMPPLEDPAHPGDPQLAYGIHYPSLSRPSTGWDRAFGNASGKLPVVVTEWDANSTTNCLPSFPAAATLLLSYLANKGIGLVGFAFDLPGTIIADWSYAPTSYAGFVCGAPAGGPGQLLFGEYAAQAQAGDGSRPDPAPAAVIGAGTLARLAAADPGVTAHLFNAPRTFVTGVGAPSLAGLGTPAAVATETFADENRLAQTVDNATLRPGTGAVMYDPGPTRATPAAQQRNPGRYLGLAAQAAHAHGLLAIAAPALALARPAAAKPADVDQLDAAFLHSRLAATAARAADVLEIPAAEVQDSAVGYASFVESAAAQATRVNPGIELLSSLGPAPASAGAAELLDAALSTRQTVAGWALRTPPAAAPLLSFLRRLARLDG